VRSFASPVISSARLDLREFGRGDAGLVGELVTAGEPEALPPGGPAAPGEVDLWLSAQKVSTTRIDLMMLDRAENRIVGGISLYRTDWNVRSAEVGYGVRGDARGRGYATEALIAVTRWALAVGGLQRVMLTANTDNTASIRVAEKAMFRREGTLRRARLENDGLHDLAVFSLLDDEAII
jgi:RimJ/RimL family protein N-acetyltransferase